jgi:apolipoprotein N-acyltransferase
VRNLSPLKDHLAPLLAMAGAGIPWIVYDLIIEKPSYFWTYRGLIFILFVIAGALAVVLAWCWSRGPSDQNGSSEDDFLNTPV